MVDLLPYLSLLGMSVESRDLCIGFTFSDSDAGVALVTLTHVAEVLSMNVRRGAFGAFDVPCDAACAPIERGCARDRDGGLTIDISIQSVVDIRAFQCLRNMARKLRREGVHVSHVQVLDTRSSQRSAEFMPWPDEMSEDDTYPQLRRSGAGRLAWEDVDAAKSRRCLLEWNRELSADDIEAFATWVQPWYSLILAGGYSVPIELPEDNDVIPGMVTQFDPFTIELTVDRFIASERAWIALANMSLAFRDGERAISRITVE